MPRSQALESLRDAAAESLKGLFNNLRINEYGERPETARQQFQNGLARLKTDIEHAAADIEAVFPE